VTEPRTLTVLLRGWRDGDPAARDELMSRVYTELLKIARSYLRSERTDHTWQPTDLVAEAYLRLAGSDAPEWGDRAHFFAIAARTMRQILVDHARRRNAGKRGDGVRGEAFDEVRVGAARPYELVALDEALEQLAKRDERKARVLELHYFGGLTHKEIAEVIGVHVNTVASDLRFAEAWIHVELGASS
jgi:RNA polymerase sigma-70 factor, ECF subfamily